MKIWNSNTIFIRGNGSNCKFLFATGLTNIFYCNLKEQYLIFSPRSLNSIKFSGNSNQYPEIEQTIFEVKIDDFDIENEFSEEIEEENSRINRKHEDHNIMHQVS